MDRKNRAIEIIELMSQVNNLLQKTLFHVKNDDFHEAEQTYHQANKSLLKASRIHVEMLQRQGDLDLLAVHSEDLFTGTILYKSMVKEFIDIYKKIA